MHYFLCYNKANNDQGGIGGMQLRLGMTVIILLLFASVVQAGKAAQKVTLSFKNAKIEQVFSEISKQTDYRFFYSDEVARKATPVSIDVKDVDVIDLLNELMDGQSMKYKVIAGTIIINLATKSEKMDPPPILSQEIIVFHTDEEDTSLVKMKKKMKGVIKAGRMEKPVISLPDRNLGQALVVEEPGGS